VAAEQAKAKAKGKAKVRAPRRGQVPQEYESDSEEDIDDAFRVLGGSARPNGAEIAGSQRVFRDVRMRNCSFQETQLGKAFDPSQPNGELDLDLSIPFDRTVAERLLRLAEESPDVNFSRAVYLPPKQTGLRPGHLHVDWEDKLAAALGMAVTRAVDSFDNLQNAPAAGRGG